MAKVVFIGAGSLGFTRSLVRDLLTFPLLRDATLALVDIDPERLDFARRAVQRIIDLGQYPAKIEASLDRKEALKGADAVLCTILCGNVKVWRHDIEIPKKYGVDTNIGDTRGPSGIFRALRTIPEMVAICKDMETLCPNAILLNYTNPMAMLCRAMQRTSRIQVSGLCHSVQGTAMMLADWIGAPMEEVTYTCAGLNHLSWFVKFEHNHQDAYPRLREVVRRSKKIRESEQVRNEMFLSLGYYVTESSGHNSEYNWWFRKRPDLIEKYCSTGTNWNPGRYGYILDEYLAREGTWQKDAEAWLAQDAPISLERGHEYATSIINARLGGEPFRFNGNVPNKGLITNLPQDCCVEVPVFADRAGFNPVQVGALPPQCAILTSVTAQLEEMVVEGCLTGDPALVYQAIAHDPLTAAVLSLGEIKKMVQEMFRKNKKHLPTFPTIKF